MGFERLLIISGRLFVIPQLVFDISHVIGHDIVLAQAEGRKGALRESGITSLLIVFQKSEVDDVSGQKEQAQDCDQAAEQVQKDMQEPEGSDMIGYFGIHQATPPL